MPPEDVLRARDRFCSWLSWFLAVHPDIAANEAQLAMRLRMTRGALNKLMAPKSQVVPSLSTLLAAERLLGFPLNVLLNSDPPAIPGMSR